MRELTKKEVQKVNGGLSARDGGMLIIGISSLTPVLAMFGYPIGFSLLAVDYMFSDK